jgi:hypothetical protein
MANASYIASEITITRQEGDTGSVIFTVPEVIDLPTFTVVKFHVFRSGVTFIHKELDDSSGDLTVVDQVITIDLWEEDTQGYKGTNRWELEISGNPDDEIITIGKGEFIIVKERIL